MKFFEKRGIAFAALVLAIAAAVFIGQSRKAGYIEKQPSELPQVEYHQWICDDAGMLTDTTKDAIRQYNSVWDSKYYAIVAVATVDSLTGWTPEEAALQLGADWNLGANDMLLMMVRNDDYYVACGDNVLWVLSNYDTMQAKLKQAIESAYYSGDFDAAALAFYRQADVFYGQAQLGSTSADTVWTEPAQPGGVDVLGVILLIVAIFVVWMLLDAVRYRRYRRRYVTGAPVTEFGMCSVDQIAKQDICNTVQQLGNQDQCTNNTCIHSDRVCQIDHDKAGNQSIYHIGSKVTAAIADFII